MEQIPEGLKEKKKTGWREIEEEGWGGHKSNVF